jgi:hypothetical protein
MIKPKKTCRQCYQRKKTYFFGSNNRGFCVAPLKKPDKHFGIYNNYSFCFVDEKREPISFKITYIELLGMASIILDLILSEAIRQQEKKY